VNCMHSPQEDDVIIYLIHVSVTGVLKKPYSTISIYKVCIYIKRYTQHVSSHIVPSSGVSIKELFHTGRCYIISSDLYEMVP
jgi:hypothetical protein